MSDDLAVFEAVAASLVGGPASSPVDPAAVRAILDRALRSPGSRQDLVAWLDARVGRLSGGRVRVEQRPADIAGPPCGAGMAGEDSSDAATAPGLLLRLVVADEPFAEPVVVRAGFPAVQFPMRS